MLQGLIARLLSGGVKSPTWRFSAESISYVTGEIFSAFKFGLMLMKAL